MVPPGAQVRTSSGDTPAEDFRILLLEDNRADAELLIAQLRRDGLDFSARIVSAELEFRQQISDFAPHIILSDFTLPQFDGLTALSIARSIAPATPFVFVSGTIGEERAVAALKSGASDYVLKDNLARLVPTILNAIRQAETAKARDLAEGMLRRSESRLRDIIDRSSDWIWECDSEGRFTFSSPSVEEILGYGPHELLGESTFAYLLPGDHQQFRSVLAKLRADSVFNDSVTLRWRRKDGASRYLERKMVVVNGDAGGVYGFRGIDRDVTNRRLQERRITRLNRALEFLSGTNSAIVHIRDRRELLKESCRLAVKIGGYSMATVYVRSPSPEFPGPIVNRAVNQKLSGSTRPPHEPLDGDGPVALVLDGAEVRVIADIADDANVSLPNREMLLALGLHSSIALPLTVDGTAIGVVQLHAEEPNVFRRDEISLLRQVTGNVAFALQHLHYEENARFLEFFDRRTSLANRTLFLQRLGRVIGSTESAPDSVSLLVLDLTGLTAINDRLGHHAGDLLLQLIAERLKNEIGDSKWLCYLGGGRFAAARPGRQGTEAAALRQCIKRVFDGPFVINDHELRSAVKAGSAQYPGDATGAEQLLQRAETALEHAKRSGDIYVEHTSDMSTEASARLSLTNLIRRHAAEERFVLNYQPTIECVSGRVEGVEALLRWPDGDPDSIPPGVFVPMLESMGLIDQVGSWVMRRALVDVRSTLLSGLDQLAVAVNVSPLQLRRETFLEDTLTLLRDHVDEKMKLVLEVTESTLLADPGSAGEMLTRLREAGATIAIDDFGTGHSSLKLLTRLPVDVLKIDRSFVRDLPHDRNNYMIVRTTLGLAKSLGLKTIAEGVETRQQFETLVELGCDSVQGYYILRPAPIADVRDWLSDITARPLKDRWRKLQPDS
jgi:diguanylate cyclase (GGDEF)-like protein/PAS domain S-box-containing protein